MSESPEAPPVLALASTSPRRSQLLRAAGIGFTLVEPGPEPAAAGSPAEKALARACSKALGADRSTGLPVLGVDTVVDVDGVEFGKPADAAAASAMLAQLVDRVHLVHTAHCLVEPGGGVHVTEVVTSKVLGRGVDPARLQAYLASGEWRGKAGGYGIQDRGQPFLELSDGAFDTVVGLHVPAVRRLLQALGS